MVPTQRLFKRGGGGGNARFVLAGQQGLRSAAQPSRSVSAALLAQVSSSAPQYTNDNCMSTRTAPRIAGQGTGHGVQIDLHPAIANGNTRVVRALLRAGADPHTVDVRNPANNTPLHVAAGKGQTTVIELLLDAGADPNVINRSGDTPLHAGSANGHADVVTALLQGGAWFNVENSQGQVPREIAGAAFSASSRGRPQKRVLDAFKSFARYRKVADPDERD